MLLVSIFLCLQSLRRNRWDESDVSVWPEWRFDSKITFSQNLGLLLYSVQHQPRVYRLFFKSLNEKYSQPIITEAFWTEACKDPPVPTALQRLIIKGRETISYITAKHALLVSKTPCRLATCDNVVVNINASKPSIKHHYKCVIFHFSTLIFEVHVCDCSTQNSPWTISLYLWLDLKLQAMQWTIYCYQVSKQGKINSCDSHYPAELGKKKKKKTLQVMRHVAHSLLSLSSNSLFCAC